MKDILYAKWTACAPFRGALLNTRGLHIIEGTIDPYWGTGVLSDIAATMHPDQLKGSNVLGTLLVELREAVATDDPNTTADEAASPTIAPMDHSATQRVQPPPPSDAPMDQTNSQSALSAPGNCTNHPMLQPITQSAPSVPGTTNPPLGPESVKSTAHAAQTPNPPALELVTTQTADGRRSSLGFRRISGCFPYQRITSRHTYRDNYH